MKLDLDFVRAQFPAFSVAKLEGQSFFENAGGSFTCKPVIDRLTRFYTERKVQPYASYAASRLGGEEMDEARNRLAAWMGVDTDEVSFGPSTTQNTYVLAQAFQRFLKPGDAIIVTNQDHEANSGPWRWLADAGIEVREWKVDPTNGHLPMDGLANLLDEKVKLVCCPHCSNIVGEVNPIREIADLVHQAGAYICVDGVSYAPHGVPDVAELGADIYLFSAYKVYGPHQGIMVIRRALGEALPNQGHYFNAGSLYKRFTPAGPDHAQVAASAGMIDYFEALFEHHEGQGNKSKFVHDLLRNHEIRVMQPLLDHIASKNSVRLIGPENATNRAPTIALETKEAPANLAKSLCEKGINCDGGDFYAVRLLEGLGIEPDRGVLRLSFVHYTGSEDVDRLMEALDDVL